MSTNPARTFSPALYGIYWHALWIYFIAPPLGMLAAAEVFLLACGRKGPYCAKLHHDNDKRCIFHHSEALCVKKKITADRLVAFSDVVCAVIAGFCSPQEALQRARVYYGGRPKEGKFI
jgi:Major intrinsic protein